MKDYKHQFFNEDCKHPIHFRESLPRGSKWYCRYCFEEIKEE